MVLFIITINIHFIFNSINALNDLYHRNINGGQNDKRRGGGEKKGRDNMDGGDQSRTTNSLKLSRIIRNHVGKCMRDIVRRGCLMRDGSLMPS